MANTVIQIKRSTGTSAPSAGSLAAAEPAYSYLSDKLFLGTSDGSQVIEIGGRYYVNVAVQAYDAANTANDRAVAAFNYANTLALSGGLTAFSNISVGGVFLVADSNADVLTIQSGNGISITADSAQDSYNVTLSATGVSATTYGASDTIVPTFTVDAFGRITSAANVTITSASAAAAGANAFAAATIAGANTAVGGGANAFTSATVAGANTAVGTGANAFTSATISGANTAVGAGANNYANSTFVKLTAANQTITGNLSITGSLTVAGNSYTIDTETLRINDPLIYLAGNNYLNDVVDIGFIANYNSGSANLHTGLFREHTNKEYYLFEGYNQEPFNNHIDPGANGFTIAVLNATLKTSNLILGSINAIPWITAAYDKANAANLLAFNTGIGANVFTAATIAGANTAVGAGANAFASATIAGANTAVGTGANNYLLAVIAGANTAVGAGANAYAAVVGAAANTNAANASYINTGILGVGFGGTGRTTFANNGVLFGNTTSGIRVTAAGTEGNVLQVNTQGTPFFGMLDGGSF